MQTTAGNSTAERDLKSLSMQELQEKLGASPAGLTRVRDSDVDIPEALRGGPSDDLSHTHPRAVLVDTACADSVRGGSRHASGGHAHRGLRPPDARDRLGLGTDGLGVRARVVPGERSD